MIDPDRRPGDPAEEVASHAQAEAGANTGEMEAGSPEDLEGLSVDETRRILHELRAEQLELKRQNEELREGESRLRAKLNALLTPGDAPESLKLADIVDVPAIREMMQYVFNLTGIASALGDLEGTALVALGWQDICTQYHRAHPESCESCTESDTVLSARVAPGTFRIYKCKNNLVDLVSPIHVSGRHVGNIFLGQFLFEDEVPDLDLFRAQAKRFGFAEAGYLSALERVPRLKRETVSTIAGFLSRFTALVSDLTYRSLRLAQTVNEQNRVDEALRESEASLREAVRFNEQVIRSAQEGVIVYGPDLRYRVWNPYMEELSGLPASEVLGKHPLEVFPFLMEAGVIERFEKVLAGEAVRPVDFPFRVPGSGKSGWATDSSAALHDVDGRVIGVIGMVGDTTARKAAEEALTLSEARYRFALEVTDQIGWSTPPDGLVEDMPLWRRYSGQSVEEVKGWGWLDAVHPEDRARTYKAWGDAAARKIKYETEYRIRRADGAYRWFLVRGIPLLNPDGTTREWAGTCIDITARKAAEDRLRSSEENLAVTLHSIGDAVIATDDAGLITRMNPTAERLTGWPLAEATGRPLTEVFRTVHAQTRVPSVSPVQGVIAHGQVVGLSEHTALLARDGQEYQIAHSAAPIRDAAGQVIGGVLVFSDVTEKYRVEQALQLTRFSVEKASDAIFWMTPEARIADVNEAACRSLGYTREELLGLSVPDVDAHFDAERWPGHFAELRQRGCMTFESEQVRRDGRLIPVEVVANYVAFGEDERNCAFVRDITERKRAEEALRGSEERFNTAFQFVPVSLAITTVGDGRFLAVNRAFESLFGYSQEDLVGRDSVELRLWANPGDRGDIVNLLKANRPVQGREAQIRRMDGSLRWVAYSGQLVNMSGVPCLLSASVDITEQKRDKELIERRIVALTQPMEGVAIAFDELFNLAEIQRIQDEFAAATGVASIITHPDGTPITGPSNFTYLCSEIIRKTEQGCSNCFKSDAALGRYHPDGPLVRPCLSGGLWDAGASITVGGHHIANWLIGQVRDSTQTDEHMRAYAHEIGADETSFLEAFHAVPAMSHEQFERIARALFTLSNQLSTAAYQNVQQARFITERRQAEVALRESSELLTLFVNHSPIYAYIKEVTPTESRVLQASENFQQMIGIKGSEMIGKTMAELFPADLAEKALADDRAVVSGSEVLEVAEELNGRSYTTIKFPIVQGGKALLAGFTIDITDRKRAEEEHVAHLGFLESLERVDRAFRQAVSLEGMLADVLDATLSIYSCDRAWLVYPCDPESASWSVRVERTRPEYPGALPAGSDLPATPEVRQRFLEVLTAHGPVVFDPQSGRALPLSSRQLSVQSQIQTAVFPKTGKPWVFGMHQCSYARVWNESDVRLFTELARRLADGLSIFLFLKDLQKSESHLRTILQTVPDLIWLKDPDGAYLDCNREFERLFGARKRDIVGRTDYDFVERGLADSFREHDRTAMAASKPTSKEEWVTFADDGRRALLETIKTPMFDAGGELVGVLGIARDITERFDALTEKAHLEDQLRHSQKVEAIGLLAGGVAHDFNNLTAIVLGYGEMLLGQLAAEDPSRRWAEQIVAAGRRSAALARQLLAFSRKQTLQPVVLDLNSLLRNLEKMLGRVIGEDVELKLKLDADPGRVKADPGQLEQVVTNLALNARDAMPRGGTLTVETTEVELDEMYAQGHESVVPGRYVMLALTDTGCGMDKATMARLFEPFFTTKPKGKGTGLGLATSYGIVKQSGGYLWGTSEPGRGTTFRICLPGTEAAVEESAAGTFEGVPRGSGERILLVEDESPLRELCELVLTRLGYRVSVAANGVEALQLVQEQGLKPDLVLTDVIMPVMGGAELAERLHRDRADLEVLYMSGYPDDAIARHGVLDPGTSFIQKPFTERGLAAKVRELLGGRKAVARGAGQRVLMIDDDGQFRELVQHFCRRGGHLFAGVDSAAAALAALAQEPFDVLLVDLNIPGTSGEQVLREIRAAGHATPAVALTGHVASADLDALRPLGAVLVLEKSSDAGPLLRAIEEAAGRYER